MERDPERTKPQRMVSVRVYGACAWCVHGVFAWCVCMVRMQHGVCAWCVCVCVLVCTIALHIGAYAWWCSSCMYIVGVRVYVVTSMVCVHGGVQGLERVRVPLRVVEKFPLCSAQNAALVSE